MLKNGPKGNKQPPRTDKFYTIKQKQRRGKHYDSVLLSLTVAFLPIQLDWWCTINPAKIRKK